MLVTANIELIWVIIVIISVIAQIRKGIKKNASQAAAKTTGRRESPPEPRTPGESPECVSSDEALREFLQRLGGTVPAVPPTPRPATHLPPAARRAPHRHPPPPPRPLRPVESVSAPVVLDTSTLAAESATDSQAERIRKDLKDFRSARRAVIMREILGPPLALR